MKKKQLLILAPMFLFASTFVGCKSGGDTPQPEPTPVVENYYIMFESDNGDDPNIVIVKKGDKVSKPNDPSKKGATFKGWYTDRNYQTAFDFDQAITSNCKVYAKWELNVSYEGLGFELDQTGKGYLVYCEDPDKLPTSFKLPSVYDGKPVTGFGFYYEDGGKYAYEPYRGGFQNCTNLEEIEIPDSYTSVDVFAFRNCVSLKRVTLGKNIKSIGFGAFSNCISLVSINLPEELYSIDDGAFAYCSSLKEIVFPSSLSLLNAFDIDRTPYYGVTVGGIFEGCVKLESAIFNGNNIASIPQNCFAICASLKKVKIPASIIYIEDFAFYGCKKLILEKTDFEDPHSEWSTNSDTYSLEYINDLKNDMVNGERAYKSSYECVAKDGTTKFFLTYTGTTQTENGEVYKCSLASHYSETYSANLEIPSYVTCGETDFLVTSIAKEAFSWNSDIVSVTLPNTLKSISKNSFDYANKLESIEFKNPDSKIDLTYIDDGSFLGNKFKKFNSNSDGEFIIPNGVVWIGSYLYSSDYINYVSIPSSLQSIHPNSFAYNDNVTFDVNKDNKYYKVVDDCVFTNDDELFIYPTNKISDDTIILPTNTKYISSNAFNFESQYKYNNVKTLVLNDNLEYFGSGLAILSKLETIECNKTSKNFSVNEEKTILYNKDGTKLKLYTIAGSDGSESAVIESKVKEIDYFAFQPNDVIQWLNLNNVETVRSYSVAFLSNLKILHLGESIKHLDKNFLYCSLGSDPIGPALDTLMIDSSYVANLKEDSYGMFRCRGNTYNHYTGTVFIKEGIQLNDDSFLISCRKYIEEEESSKAGYREFTLIPE